MLIEVIHFMRRNGSALDSFISIGYDWKRPMTKDALTGRLTALEQKFVAAAGPPMIS